MSNKIYEASTIKQEINFETGEIKSIEQERYIVKKIDQSEFVLVYLHDIIKILSIADINFTDIKVLAQIWELAQFNTGEVYLIKLKKEAIATKLNLTISAIEKSVIRLSKNKLIIKQGDGRNAIYIINPSYFWKGTEISRQKSLKLIIKYEIQEQEQQVNLFNENE